MASLSLPRIDLAAQLGAASLLNAGERQSCTVFGEFW